MKRTALSLRKVQVSDDIFLHYLYNQRDPRRNTTKRTELENKRFLYDYVRGVKHYYAAWYIVMIDNKQAGSYTITHDNETGSWLLPEYCNKGIGTEAYLELFRLQQKKHYNVNVEAWDTRTQAMIIKLGYKLTRLHYER